MIAVELQTISHRRELRQYIKDSAREIQESTELLDTLFILENGVDRHSTHGFGYVELNDPSSTTVTYDMSEEKFQDIITQLYNASSKDLGNEEDEQLDVIAENLSVVADTLSQYETV